MKQGYFVLCASIAAALVGAPAFAGNQAVAGLNLGEAARVTQTVNNQLVTPIQRTHLKFTNKRAPLSRLADSTPMNHLQLVLKRSAPRQAALDSLIADQHNPQSARFQKWLSPQQFGSSFGVVDSDIEAAKSWLVSQGFTVNKVYPNKMQIDFSGNAGLVNHAFHTQENHYKMNDGSVHVANVSDISIPSALKDVVTGVMGLNSFHPEALNRSKVAKYDAKSGLFNVAKAGDKVTHGGKIGQAISFSNGARGLVPNDLATMYNVKALRDNGVTGTGVTIAVLDAGDMYVESWENFRTQFNLTRFEGTFSQIQPAGPATCSDPGFPINKSTGLPDEDGETLLDAEWATAIAPGANIVVANCAFGENDNAFSGVYAAGVNLINADEADRPNIISASYGLGEQFTDSASKAEIDLMWAQADAEGISVFVSTGDSGSNPSFNGNLINGYYGNTAVDANSFATSANVTGVGGTDTADVLDGTTSKYFASVPSSVYGSALSYVPEIPWNESCGNGVAAKSLGYNRAIGFCNDVLRGNVADYPGVATTSEAGSGGPSSVVRKPSWQRQVFNAAQDQSRDLPDVSLFAGSFGGKTYVITCTQDYPCNPGFTGSISVSGGTSLSSPMFAGIQALMNQGLAARGLPINQGNAAPTLYALAANEYGGANKPNVSTLAACNSDNGAAGSDNCVFHNITRGSISSGCFDIQGAFTTPNCFIYNSIDLDGGAVADIGLTTTDASPTGYTVSNKAFGAGPGWSFATGLGSVNARNLLIAWRAFVGAPAAPIATVTK